MNPTSLSDDLHQTAHEARQQSSATLDRARDEARGMCHCASEKIRECPISSVLIAAAAGVAIGWLLGTSSRTPWHEQALHDLRGNAGDAVDKLRHNLKFW